MRDQLQIVPFPERFGFLAEIRANGKVAGDSRVLDSGAGVYRTSRLFLIEIEQGSIRMRRPIALVGLVVPLEPPSPIQNENHLWPHLLTHDGAPPFGIEHVRRNVPPRGEEQFDLPRRGVGNGIGRLGLLAVGQIRDAPQKEVVRVHEVKTLPERIPPESGQLHPL